MMTWSELDEAYKTAKGKIKFPKRVNILSHKTMGHDTLFTTERRDHIGGRTVYLKRSGGALTTVPD